MRCDTIGRLRISGLPIHDLGRAVRVVSLNNQPSRRGESGDKTSNDERQNDSRSTQQHLLNASYSFASAHGRTPANNPFYRDTQLNLPIL